MNDSSDPQDKTTVLVEPARMANGKDPVTLEYSCRQSNVNERIFPFLSDSYESGIGGRGTAQRLGLEFCAVL